MSLMGATDSYAVKTIVILTIRGAALKTVPAHAEKDAAEK
jgi:hypothetical protein